MRPCLRAVRRVRDDSGQALVEFAIAAPLIVMVLLFAIWFVELIQIKLKVLETARYAAWEATSYPLHATGEGPSKLSGLASQMRTGVQVETTLRYGPQLGKRLLSAQGKIPAITLTQSQEELVYGGPIVNLLFGIAGSLYDFFSGRSYTHVNAYAQALVAVGKSQGGAMSERLFGSTEWGFNRGGYTTATVSTVVTNSWLNRGVGSMVLPNWGVTLTEKHAVLADTWNLEEGRSIPQDQTAAGLKGPGADPSSRFWKQLKLMHLYNSRVRGVAEVGLRTFKSTMDVVAGMMGHTSPISWEQIRQPAVVSRSYTDRGKGRVWIREDDRSTLYDTTPVVGEHQRTLLDRGNFFMGCPKDSQLGCPSSGLQQDDPFGGFIHRD